MCGNKRTLVCHAGLNRGRIRDALRFLTGAAERSGANRGRLREELASGAAFAGQMRFDSTGELQAR